SARATMAGASARAAVDEVQWSITSTNPATARLASGATARVRPNMSSGEPSFTESASGTTSLDGFGQVWLLRVDLVIPRSSPGDDQTVIQAQQRPITCAASPPAKRASAYAV